MRRLNVEFIKKNILYIIIIIFVVIILVLAVCIAALKEKCNLPELQPQTIKLQDLAAGQVGEIVIKDETTGEDGVLVSAILPLTIFNTAGDILEVKKDRLIVYGEGSNFADGLSRQLNVIFTDETVTFTGGQTFRWLGATGLAKLNPGMKILINSSENIRGKTTFMAKNINILSI